MTWFADEILLPATDRAREAIAADPLLAPFAYWVRDLRKHDWPRDEHRHDLPEGGVIAIHPVRDTRADDEDSAYPDELPSLDWSRLQPARAHGPEPDRIGQRLSAYLLECTGELASLPPPPMRAYLGELSARIEAPVLFYSAFLWGGAVEYEYSLCYRGHEALFLTRPPAEPGDEVVQHALHDGLGGIGVHLPTPYFALHTRSFPWARHRLSDAG